VFQDEVALVQLHENPRKPRYEPAKFVGSDGQLRLHGVKSTSDVVRYSKNRDPHSKNYWQVRESVKAMRAEQHRATSENTWRALHKWQASEKTIDRFYAAQLSS